MRCAAALAFATAIAAWTPAGAQSAARGGGDGDLAEARDEARDDVAAARASLETAREHIGAERDRLSERLAAGEQRIAELETRLAEIRESRRRAEEAAGELERDQRGLADRTDALEAALVELRRALEAELAPLAARRVQPELGAIDDALAGGPGDLARAARSLVSVAADELRRARRVRTVPGKAVGPGGDVAPGTFVAIGAAAAAFASTDPQGPAGVVTARPKRELQVTPAAGARRAVADVASGRRAPLPISLAPAPSASGSTPAWVERLRQGGAIVVVLLALALACAAVAIAKSVQLVRARSNIESELAELARELRAGRIADARKRADGARPPLRRVMQEALAHREIPREHLEELLHEAIIAEMPKLERHLPVLAVGAAVAPLLGLLGTVTGMIDTFGVISVHGTGDPKLLSGGISQALVTTEVGLVVAIPALVAHAFLSRRVRAIGDDLEKNAISLINALKIRAADADADDDEPAAALAAEGAR